MERLNIESQPFMTYQDFPVCSLSRKLPENWYFLSIKRKDYPVLKVSAQIFLDLFVS